jgi:hypothetical protein
MKPEWHVVIDGYVAYSSEDILDCLDERDELGEGRVTDTVK